MGGIGEDGGVLMGEGRGPGWRFNGGGVEGWDVGRVRSGLLYDGLQVDLFVPFEQYALHVLG